MSITNKISSLSSQAALKLYTAGEETANSITHAIGTLGAMAGLVLLCLKTKGLFGGQMTGKIDLIAVILFTGTMIGMYMISTLYHFVQKEGAKSILRKLDHSLIFIFIAGTYTPFCLTALAGPWGWSILIFEWSLALICVILHFFNNKSFKKIETAVYILMGWAIVAGCVPLFRRVPVQSIIFLILGGLAYTYGVRWYRKKEQKYSHAVWHILVIAGTVCHWFSIWYLM